MSIRQNCLVLPAYTCWPVKIGYSAAVAPSCRAIILADHMVVNPFGNQHTRFAQGRFGVVDTVKGGTGVKRGYVCRTHFA